ncbi:MAG TPA: PorP/SprF family type IX secretion system membrane protein [Puia sp.]|nr:PorP/SprF family type IX secretion system membrane protein [Puia sp.]
MKILTHYIKNITVYVFMILAVQNVMAQDIHFSQFFEAPLLRNPSLAGIFVGDYRIQGVYRDQWNSITNGYRTGSLNAELKSPVGKGNDFITTGLQCLFDKAGTAGLTTTQVLPALNYHKSLSDQKTMYLSLGFMGGYVSKIIDRSKVTTSNQYSGGVFNPSIPDGETFPSANIHYWDASVGMSFNTTFGQDQENSMFLGAAFHHLNRPRNSFYQNSIELDPKYVFSGGLKLHMDENSFMTLQADYSTQGGFRETIAGALYSYKLGYDTEDPQYILSLGMFLRWQDALVPVIKLDMLPLSVALSYDVNISQLKTVSQGRGGIELSISYIGFLERDNSSKYKMLCPHF